MKSSRDHSLIPLAEPVLSGNEKKYVEECLDSGWISGSGKFVSAFEQEFAHFCGAKHAITVNNGTVGLHLALLAFQIGLGDEVLVPDLTYIATANAVVYCGATPVLVDIDPVTWTMDVLDAKRKITSRTRAILPVHLYGHPANMRALNALAKEHGLFVLEDAAEAHGAECYGQRAGVLGTAAVFSFYGNKIITTGEGGMITTNAEELAERMYLLRGQGMDPTRRYWFPTIGYNYRMSNIQAAIGLAQLERIEWFIQRRIEVASLYSHFLRSTDVILPAQAEWAKNVYWLFSVCLPQGISRDTVLQQLLEHGIETRPFFYPLHVLPPYQQDTPFPIASSIAARGLSLPSSATLAESQIRYVCEMLKTCIARQKAPFTAG